MQLAIWNICQKAEIALLLHPRRRTTTLVPPKAMSWSKAQVSMLSSYRILSFLLTSTPQIYMFNHRWLNHPGLVATFTSEALER